MKVTSADELVEYEGRLTEREKRLLEIKRDPPEKDPFNWHTLGPRGPGKEKE